MRDLPRGTVTFLFTDIEGSTKLLHELGAEAYAEALAEHRRVLRAAFGRHGGVEVDTQGDAFFYAFPTAPGALAAAAEGRAALASGPVRVRMGVHTGTPHRTEEGYVGADVHRAARIAAAAHGGQVLVSASTAALVQTDGLRELGEHRLKDLSAPERIYQLGEGDFPPLKSLYRTNLPVPSASFLGRERELEEVSDLLGREDVRLVTLTGPGGTGKTRLALQAAAAQADRFPDGVWWVQLAPLRDPQLVLEEAAQALDSKDGLAEHISDRHLLLLFDNFEQVAEAASGLPALLEACPNLEVLVTSREPLRLAAEREYAVPTLAESEAVALFRERALEAEPEETVRAICRRLDCLPLAVELAAARTRALSPHQILERLDQRLPLLTGGPRDAPERQRTLRATVDWSHELLPGEEQKLFRRLAIFSAGWTLEAAEQVCEADLDTLQSLVEKSLVKHTGERFWMLETIREYASEQLDRSENVQELCRRHATYFARVADGVSQGIHGADQAQAIEQLRAERDNVRSAVEWAIRADASLCARIVAAVGRYWAQFVGSSKEGRRWLNLALDIGADVDPQLRAALCLGAATTAMHAGDYDAMRAHAEAALDLQRMSGSEEQFVDALYRLADANQLAGDPERAQELYMQAIASARRGPYQWPLAQALSNLGYLLLAEGDERGAIEVCTEGVELHRALGNRSGVAAGLCNLGLASLLIDRLDEAAASFREGLELSVEIGQSGLQACCVDGLAAIASARGAHEVSARLIGHSEAVLARAGAVLQPIESALHERTLEKVRAQLGASAVDAALDAGRRMLPKEAIAQALSID